MRVFAVYSWHSERWTPRNQALMEAVVMRARTTRHPWLIACYANMCPEGFKKSLRLQGRHMFIEAPREGGSTCRSKGPIGEFIERTDQECGRGGRFRIKTTHGGHFLGRKRERNPKILPAFSGGKLPGRSKAEGGREEEEEEGRKVEIPTGEPRELGVGWKDGLKGVVLSLKQKWEDWHENEDDEMMRQWEDVGKECRGQRSF